MSGLWQASYRAVFDPLRSDTGRVKNALRVRWVEERLPGLLRALASALAGGGLFWLLGLPMAWLLGSIIGTAVLVMFGVQAQVPAMVRNLVLIVLGLMIGATLQPGVLHDITRWPISLIGVVIYVVTVTGLQYLFLRRVGGYDAPTAYFSSAPGGFMAMTVIGGEFGGRERLIALTHAVRIVLVVFVIVFGYHLLTGQATGSAGEYVPIDSLSPGTICALAAIGAGGTLVARLLRLPGGYMLGPLAAMAAIRLGGAMPVAMPTGPIWVAEVVLGSSIGAQFAGATPAELRQGFVLSLCSTAFMLLLTLVFSLVLEAVTGLQLTTLILAFSPGGMSGISLIALALNIEPAFVTVHNMVRVLVILVAGPALFRSRVIGDGDPY